jgi:hypothetical protein
MIQKNNDSVERSVLLNNWSSKNVNELCNKTPINYIYKSHYTFVFYYRCVGNLNKDIKISKNESLGLHVIQLL